MAANELKTLDREAMAKRIRGGTFKGTHHRRRDVRAERPAGIEPLLFTVTGPEDGRSRSDARRPRSCDVTADEGPGRSRVEGLGVRYGALVALDDVSWEVGPGELLGIIGPNGAGKSSCYDAVTAMVPRQGRVCWTARTSPRCRRTGWPRCGLKRAFQQNAFFDELTRARQHGGGARTRRPAAGLLASMLGPVAAARRRRAREAGAAAQLERFGVPAPSTTHRMPTDIPYGTQRMLSVALAYGAGARVLLLDEPAAGLGGDDMDRLVAAAARAEARRRGAGRHRASHGPDHGGGRPHRACSTRAAALAYGTPREVQQDPRCSRPTWGSTQ